MGNLSILWDLDGVLADTGDLHLHTWEITFQEYGIPLNMSNFRSLFGKTTPQIIVDMMGENVSHELIQEIGARKEEIFRELVPEWVKTFPGVHEALQGFQQLGIKQAIASSAPQENIETLVDALGIADYFQAFVSGHNLPSKPATEVFLKAAATLAVLPSNCIVFEDTVAGVEAAKRAGMRCIAVTNSNPPDALVKADLILPSLDSIPFEELIGIIRAWFENDG